MLRVLTIIIAFVFLFCLFGAALLSERAHAADGTIVEPPSFTAPWVYGANKLYRGRGQAYAQIHVEFAGVGAHVYWQGIEGLPPGVTVNYQCGDFRLYAPTATSEKLPWCWVNTTAKNAELYLRLAATADAPLGKFTITVTLKSGCTEGVRVPVPVEIAAPPKVTVEPLLRRVPLPATALAAWTGWMEKPGYVAYCKPGTTLNVPYEGAIWYYDGGDAYFNAMDRTGDAKYKPCAFWVVDQWRDYLNKLGYLNAGWRVFVQGLFRAWKETGDASYAKAIDIQANHAPAEVYLGPIARKWVVNSEGEMWANGSRDMYYRPEAYVYCEKTGGARVDEVNEKRPKIFVAADRALFTLDRSLNSSDELQTEWQTWMLGLGMRSLIDYYEHTKAEPQGPDTRVIDAVREVVEWAAAHMDANGAILHSPYPKGPLCAYSCQQYVALENAFIAPAAAWLWRKTGEDRFRQMADDMFVGLTKWPVETPKQWSQTMYWMHDYIKYRTEGLKESACLR